MTVTCPSCEANFRDPPADVPKTRPLQCSKCEHEWIPLDHLAPQDLAPGEVPLIQMDSPLQATDTNNLTDAENAIETTLPVTMPGSGLATETPAKREPVFVDREPAALPKRSYGGVLSTAGLACIAVLAAGVGFKHTVIAKFPQTTALYQTVGLISKTPGLTIANVVTTKSNRDGIKQLIVKGEIENIANSTVPVPPINLIMRGKSDAKLYAWTVTATKDSLKSGEKSRFTAVAHDFPDEAVNVEVEFAPAKSNNAGETNKSE